MAVVCGRGWSATRVCSALQQHLLLRSGEGPSEAPSARLRFVFFELCVCPAASTKSSARMLRPQNAARECCRSGLHTLGIAWTTVSYDCTATCECPHSEHCSVAAFCF
eukprot:363920-Chlamydomonas_euryale.AAC.15